MLPAAVLFGGPSPEHDVSILTGLQAARALAGAGSAVEAIYWTKTGAFMRVDPGAEASDFADGIPRGASAVELTAGPDGGFTSDGRLGKRRRLEVDVVLNACHGGPGEDGTIQSLMDLAGLRYTGPSAAGAALAMDKYALGAVAAAAGLATLPRAVLDPDGPPPPFDGPYIVKPRFGGSSIGIEIAADAATAAALARSSSHLADGAVIEPYLADSHDLEVSVRTDGGLRLSPIAKPLRTVDDGAILSYGDKYLGGEGMSSTPRQLPADISDEVADAVRTSAQTLAEAALVRSLVRIDFLVDGDTVVVNEINSIPGSLSLYLWKAAGDDAASVLAGLLEEASQRPRRQFSTQGSDGRALRAAGSIASKLA